MFQRYACYRCPNLVSGWRIHRVERRVAGRRFLELVCGTCLREEKQRQRERRRGAPWPMTVPEVLPPRPDFYYPCLRTCRPACPACFSCAACRRAGAAEACRHLLPRGI